jgi:hypothetical protein
MKRGVGDWIAGAIALMVILGVLYLVFWFQMAGYNDYLSCNPRTGISRIEGFWVSARPRIVDAKCRHPSRTAARATCYAVRTRPLRHRPRTRTALYGAGAAHPSGPQANPQHTRRNTQRNTAPTAIWIESPLRWPRGRRRLPPAAPDGPAG